MRKAVAIGAGLLVGAAITLTSPVPAMAARHKVDCNQVMSLLHTGQKPKAVARQLGISVSSVRRCRKKAALPANPPDHPEVPPPAIPK